MQNTNGLTTQQGETSSCSSTIWCGEHSSQGETLDQFLENVPETKHGNAAEYLAAAYEFASRRSDDPRTQTGAVIVSGQSEAYGTNRLPGVIRILPERLKSENKGKYLIHAERDAICVAAAHGIRTSHAVMFAPWACCEQCGHAIISAKLQEVVLHRDIMICTPERWSDSVLLGLQLCRESGVLLTQYSGKLNREILFGAERRIF